MFIGSPSAESVRNRHSRLARITGLDVTRRGEIRWLVAEPESTLRIIRVEQVAHPDFCAPVISRVAGLEIREDTRGSAYVVGLVEVEVIHARDVDAREVSGCTTIFHAQVVLVLRRVRLFAPAQVHVAETVVAILRIEPRAAQVEQQRGG